MTPTPAGRGMGRQSRLGHGIRATGRSNFIIIQAASAQESSLPLFALSQIRFPCPALGANCSSGCPKVLVQEAVLDTVNSRGPLLRRSKMITDYGLRITEVSRSNSQSSLFSQPRGRSALKPYWLHQPQTIICGTPSWTTSPALRPRRDPNGPQAPEPGVGCCPHPSRRQQLPGRRTLSDRGHARTGRGGAGTRGCPSRHFRLTGEARGPERAGLGVLPVEQPRDRRPRRRSLRAHGLHIHIGSHIYNTM